MIGSFLCAWLVATAPAFAATWSVPTPLSAAVGPDGQLAVPAGVAVLIESAPRVEVRVIDAVGNPIATRGTSDGQIIPAAGVSRLLTVAVDRGSVRVRFAVERDQQVSWEQWFTWADRRLARGEGAAIDLPPWGGQSLLASVRVRAAAVQDPDLARLGLRHDVETVWPLGGWGHRSVPPIIGVPEPGEEVTAQVTGPGAAAVRVTPQLVPEDVTTRFDVQILLDGRPWLDASMAAMGASPRLARVWIPPGEHQLSVSVGGIVSTVEITPATARARLLGAVSVEEAHGVGAAEKAYLEGDHVGALAMFRGYVAEPGPVGALARARVLRLSSDKAEMRALAVPPEGAEGDELVMLADAALDRADALPVRSVLALVLTAPEVDAQALAAWLDRVGGDRPAGVALLSLASPDVSAGPSPAVAAVQRATVSSRFTRLDPRDGLAADVPGAVRVLRAIGPGTPRVRLVAGGQATVTLGAAAPGRVPLLRVRAEGACRFLIDGAEWAPPRAGELTFGMAEGPHVVEVIEGELVLLDADVVTGGERLYERHLLPLPQTFDLPDPGVPVDLRVELADPGESLLAVYDDGRIERGWRDAAGRVRLRAGSRATSVTLTGASAAVLEMRAPARPADPPVPPAADVAAALDLLTRLSREVDGGEPAARLERAQVLASLGQLGLARADLTPVLEDGMLGRPARRLWGTLPPAVPTASRLGPVSVPAILASVGVDAEVPAGPPVARAEALAALADAHASPLLAREAAIAWLDAGDPLAALSYARAAGPQGADTLPSIRQAMEWRPISRSERGGGLVAVRQAVAIDPNAPVWSLARDAVVASPWPADQALVIRGATQADTIRVDGAKVAVDLYCRDESLRGAACSVPVRFDGVPEVVSVPDGQSFTIARDLADGAHEVEVGPVGDDAALVIRASVDGATIAPVLERYALHATPERPVEVVLAVPAAVRVEVLRGRADVTIDGVLVASGVEGEVELPIRTTGAARVLVSGDADLLVSRGVQRAAAAVSEAPSVTTGPAIPADELEALVARYANPTSPVLPMQGTGGTWELGLTALRDRLTSPTEAWLAGELEAAWMRRREGKWWLRFGGWGRGPSAAAGGYGQGGVEWRRGFAGLTADAGVGEGASDSAWHVDGTLHARHEVPVGEVVGLRGEGWVWGGGWSVEPLTRVDPRAWSEYDAEHFAGVGLGASAVARPWRDVRAEGGVRAFSNPGPSIDRVGPFVELDLLIGLRTAVLLDASADLRFADADRAETSVGTYGALTVDHAWWTDPTTRFSVWGRVEVLPDPLLMPIFIGIELLASPHRGLSDLPPAYEVFRTARGAP